MAEAGGPQGGSNSLKSLTILQPHASLVMLGLKLIETRGWATSYRGPLGIHAAKLYEPAQRRMCHQQPFHDALFPVFGRLPMMTGVAGRTSSWADDLPTGAMLGTVELVDVVKVEDLQAYWVRMDPDERWKPWPLTSTERAFGRYMAGNFAWLFANPVLFRAPFPCSGKQKIWDWNQ